MSNYITQYIKINLRVYNCLINMFEIFKQNLIDIAKNEIIGNVGLEKSEWVWKAFVQTYNKIPIDLYVPNYLQDPLSEDDPQKSLQVQIQSIIDPSVKKFGFDREKSIENIFEKFPDCQIIQLGIEANIIFNSKFILLYGNYLLLHELDKEFISDFMSCFIPKSRSESPKVYYVSKGTYCFEKYPFKLNVKDIEGNYNDDLPLDKVNKIINSDESSIILFNGIPGCGKSSFIRYIIDQNKESCDFLYLDSSVFNAITDSSFIQFLLANKNSVLILEDCEQLLKSRENNDHNYLISTILNISDGLLGDSLNLKFICTFNTDLTNIDKAITRKGRLKLKYEFKPLCKEKVAKIFEKQGIDSKFAKNMTLAEIYNFNEDNGSNVERKKVGFND